MTTRRGLLGMFGGATAAAASGVSPSQMAGKMGISGLPYNEPMPEPAPQSWKSKAKNSVFDAFRAEVDRRETRLYTHQMPPHIAGKKSWSDAFKVSEFNREREELHAMRREFRSNAALRNKLAKSLGLPADLFSDDEEDGWF